MSDIDYRIVQLLQSATSKAKIRAEAVLSGRETSLGKPPEVETRLITLKDAAGRLGVSRSTIGRLVKRNAFRVVPVGGKNRLTLSSVISYANN